MYVNTWFQHSSSVCRWYGTFRRWGLVEVCHGEWTHSLVPLPVRSPLLPVRSRTRSLSLPPWTLAAAPPPQAGLSLCDCRPKSALPSFGKLPWSRYFITAVNCSPLNYSWHLRRIDFLKSNHKTSWRWWFIKHLGEQLTWSFGTLQSHRRGHGSVPYEQFQSSHPADVP